MTEINTPVEETPEVVSETHEYDVVAPVTSSSDAPQPIQAVDYAQFFKLHALNGSSAEAYMFVSKTQRALLDLVNMINGEIKQPGFAIGFNCAMFITQYSEYIHYACMNLAKATDGGKAESDYLTELNTLLNSLPPEIAKMLVSKLPFTKLKIGGK